MKNRAKIKIFFILGLFVLLSSNFVIAADSNTGSETSDNPEVQALNQQIQDKKDKIESLKKTAEEYSQKINEYQNTSKSLKNQLGMLENQMVKTQLDIQVAQMQIDQTGMEVESLNYQIEKNEDKANSLKNNLIEYIKTIDKSDKQSYLEILILNNSFADFFDQLSYLEQVQDDIKQAVEQLKNLNESIGVEKADKERQKTDLENYKQSLLDGQAKLEQEQLAKKTLISDTQNSESSFKKLLAQAQAEQNEVNSEINGLQDRIKDKIERIKKSGATAANTLVMWPIESRRITAYFHDTDYPFRYLFEHPAIDIATKQGTQIHAPADGYVARTVDAGYGYSYIILIHNNQLSTVYGHVSKILVQEGSYVNAGDIIGLSGAMPGTRGAGPFTTGPHLHFEVRLNGIPVNPLDYLP